MHINYQITPNGNKLMTTTLHQSAAAIIVTTRYPTSLYNSQANE